MKKKENLNINEDLIIVKKEKETLTKEQINFNKLLEKIDYLNSKIEQEKVKNEFLLKEYMKNIPSLEKELYNQQFESARSLADATEKIKFNSKQIGAIKEVILWLCKNSFQHVFPDAEKISFYNLWSENSFEEEKRIAGKEKMEQISEQIKAQFGVDLDLSDLDDSPEGFAQLHERLQEMKDRLANDDNQHTKSKKQKHLETKKQQAESEKFQSIRKIYINLVKMMHPDLTPDPQEKLLREEMMKEVTTLYNERNLSQLLKMELQWVTKSKENVNIISNDKLKMYIANLKDQVLELEKKIIMLSAHPRFDPICHLTSISEKSALKEIKKTTNIFRDKINSTKTIIQFLKGNPSKNEVLNYVIDVRMIIEEDFYF